MLKIALEGHDENFDDIIEEAIPLWKYGLSIGSYMLTLHDICLLQVTLRVQ